MKKSHGLCASAQSESLFRSVSDTGGAAMQLLKRLKNHEIGKAPKQNEFFFFSVQLFWKFECFLPRIVAIIRLFYDKNLQ